jgi:hypothetical protein
MGNAPDVLLRHITARQIGALAREPHGLTEEESMIVEREQKGQAGQPT